jgi:hypothetical protein
MFNVTYAQARIALQGNEANFSEQKAMVHFKNVFEHAPLLDIVQCDGEQKIANAV